MGNQLLGSRSLSFSEISTAQACWARWDFSYGGRLAGSTLRARAIPALLSDGRAWGAAVAAFHSHGSTSHGSSPGHLAPVSLLDAYSPTRARIAGHEALIASYKADIARQRLAGIGVSPEIEVARVERLGQILDHYMATTVKLPNLTRLEDEINVPVPSRTGRQGSTRYRFGGFIDGFMVDEHGNEWIVEFKLRDSLTALEQIMRSAQIRWYAWARQRDTGHPVVGVLVDERLNVAPRMPKVVIKNKKAGTFRPSHDVRQITTPDRYLALCAEMDEEPHVDVVESLQNRTWQERTPRMFRPSELDEAGRELVSAAKLIRDLDSGALWPMRNAIPQLCNGCRFRQICANPQDELFVESLFERTVPKRERPSVAAASSAAQAATSENAEPKVGARDDVAEPVSSSPRGPFPGASDSSHAAATNGAIPNVGNPFLVLNEGSQ